MADSTYTSVAGDSLLGLGAAELAEKIAAKEVTSEEVTRAHLDRIAEIDGDINAFLHVGAEQALDAARAADKAIAQGSAGPLAGVPVALNDVFTTTDAPTIDRKSVV